MYKDDTPSGKDMERCHRVGPSEEHGILGGIASPGMTQEQTEATADMADAQDEAARKLLGLPAK